VTDPSETSDGQNDRPAVSATSTPQRRGSFALYAAAFVLVLAAGVFLAVAATSFLASVTPLWTSAVLSAIAIVLSIASVVVPRRP
jgi:hypothetical protein